jgi:hypothetical protein
VDVCCPIRSVARAERREIEEASDQPGSESTNGGGATQTMGSGEGAAVTEKSMSQIHKMFRQFGTHDLEQYLFLSVPIECGGDDLLEDLESR